MKRLVATITGAVICLMCYGQDKNGRIWKNMVGIDIGAAVCEGGLRICISQQFASMWSINASSMACMNKIKNSWTEEFKEHYESLGYSHDEKYSDKDLVTCSISVSHWLKEVYIGPHIHAGCRCGTGEGLSGIIGAGYCIPVWKGLRCNITYEIVLRKSIDDNIGLTISYTY